MYGFCTPKHRYYSRTQWISQRIRQVRADRRIADGRRFDVFIYGRFEGRCGMMFPRTLFLQTAHLLAGEIKL